MTSFPILNYFSVLVKDAYFLTRNPKKFRETAFFSFSKIFPLFPRSREKGVIVGRDKKISSPGSPCTTLSTSIRFVQTFWRSVSVSFILHSCSSNSPYRITELLSRIKYRNRGIFHHGVSVSYTHLTLPTKA